MWRISEMNKKEYKKCDVKKLLKMIKEKCTLIKLEK